MIVLVLRVLVVGLATYRLARALTVDSITEPLRAWVFWRGHTDHDASAGVMLQYDQPIVVSRPWAWLYGLISCPYCAGWWVALVLFLAWAGWSWAHLLAAVAAAGVGALCTSLDTAANR